LPVLKENGAAQAGAASHTPALTATPTTLERNTVRTALFISLLLSVEKGYMSRMDTIGSVDNARRIGRRHRAHRGENYRTVQDDGGGLRIRSDDRPLAAPRGR
jgi:hypothetical protein